MSHIVTVVQVNEQGDLIGVKYKHEFYFESSARKWADGFNRVYGNPDEDEDRFLAVYVGESKKQYRSISTVPVDVTCV